MRRTAAGLLLLGALLGVCPAAAGPVDSAAVIRETPRQDRAGSPLVLALGMAAIIAAEVAVLAVILRRRHRARTAAAQAPAPAAVLPAAADEVPLRAPEPAAVEPGDAESAGEQSEELLEEPAVLLARRLRRGKGEIDLALRLESQGDDRMSAGLRQLRSGGATAPHRVRIAKRLGVGRGEVELAMRLRELESGNVHKETTR